ncbi:MAG: V-type ATPase 116kDa subunit family protein, partial [Oscillospiraceae bacterium]
MGMEKMQYVNIYGNEKSPQSALEILSRLECFHPEEKVGDKVKGEVNADVYMPLAIKIDGLLQDLGVGTIIKTAKPTTKALPVEVNPTFEFEKVDKFVEAFVKQVSARSVKKAEIQKEITVYSQAKTQLTHLGGMSASVDDIYNLGFLKVRFGRLPKESYSKLSYYAEKDFAFTSYDFDGESYWGVYFTPAETAEEADRVFESLYFERIWVPEFVHGTPAEAMDKLTKKLSELNAKMRELSTISDIATMQDIENLQKMKIWAEYNSQIFEMQKYAVVLDDSFLISGYVPKKDFSKVKKALEVLSTVKVSEDDDNAPLLKTPVKLKNNWFSRPFEMFVNMYGLPSYGDIDPTTFVSITYAILFGIMFGDVGQGVLLGIIGFFIMYKKMHMDIGLILARCSVFSVFFG